MMILPVDRLRTDRYRDGQAPVRDDVGVPTSDPDSADKWSGFVRDAQRTLAGGRSVRNEARSSGKGKAGIVGDPAMRSNEWPTPRTGESLGSFQRRIPENLRDPMTFAEFISKADQLWRQGKPGDARRMDGRTPRQSGV